MTLANPLPLSVQLRGCIAEEHDAIEKTAYSIHMMGGTLAPEIYAFNLAQFVHIHQCFETLAGSSSEMIGFFSDAMRRTETALRDLNNLGYGLSDFAVLCETTRCIENIVLAHETCPQSLIGGVYVLEGSRMGSMVIAKPLARCLNVTGELNTGIDYHLEGAHLVMPRLKSWKGTVDSAGFSPATTGHITNFARQFMRDLVEMYRAMPMEPATVETRAA